MGKSEESNFQANSISADAKGRLSRSGTMADFIERAMNAPVLSVEQEVSIWSEINELMKIAPTNRSKPNQRRLLLLKNTITEAYLPLAIEIAHKYVGKGVPKSDLIQEACAELVETINEYEDFELEEFEYFATKRIKARLSIFAENQSKEFRVPKHMKKVISTINFVSEMLEDVYKRKATDLEVGQYLNIDKSKMSEIRIYEAKFLATPLSLEQIIEDQDEYYEHLLREFETNGLVNQAFVSKTQSTDSMSNQDARARAIALVLAGLSPRESKLISLRFGLNDEQSKTLDQIAEVMGITIERARAIEAKAMFHLQHPARAHLLRDFL